MRMQLEESKGKLMPTNIASTEFDHLPLPKDKKIIELNNSELASALIDAGVPGVEHEHGRSQNLKAYDDFLEKIRKDASEQAVSKWVKAKS